MVFLWTTGLVKVNEDSKRNSKYAHSNIAHNIRSFFGRKDLRKYLPRMKNGIA